MKQTTIVLITALTASIAVSGCNSSGEVLMSKAVSPADNNPPSASQQRSSTGPSDNQDPIVYFDRVSVRDGIPEALVGLGFLREGASTRNAFGLRFRAPGAFGDQPRLDAHESGILYLKPDGAGHERLLLLDPSTLSDTELARMPTGIRYAAVSADLRSFAWAEPQNGVFAAFNGALAQSLPLQGGMPQSLTFAAESNDLQVSVASSTGSGSTTTVVFQGRPDPSEAVSGYPVARETRSGRIAAGVRDSSGLLIQVTDPRDSTEITIPVEGRAIRSLKWSSEGMLAFLLERADGSLALMKATPETGETALLAQLNLPSSPLADRIVCPAWYGGSLYFADASNSSFAIFHAVFTDGSWTVQPFARASSTTQGFVCPKLSQTAGGRS